MACYLSQLDTVVPIDEHNFASRNYSAGYDQFGSLFKRLFQLDNEAWRKLQHLAEVQSAVAETQCRR